MPSQSLHQQIIDAAVPIVQGLNLKTTGNVAVAVSNRRTVQFQQMDVYPVVMLLAAGTETADGGTTGKDDIGYPVGIALIDRAPGEDETLADLWLLWRRQIRNKFIHQRQLNAGNGFPSLYDCRWEPGAILEVKALEYEKLLGTMVLRFMSRETRGP